MKKILIAAMIALSASSMVIVEAEAKRLGGGGSFGRQSQGMQRQAPSQSNQASQPNQAGQSANQSAPAAAPQTAPQRPASPWRNILGGALLGLGLGALLSHLGLGGAMANIIATILMIGLIALAIMFIVRLVRGKSGNRSGTPAYAAGASAGGSTYSRTPDIGSRIDAQTRPQPAAFQAEPSAGAVTTQSAFAVPADFDTQAFLRNAKTYFIRLQAAWDRADVNDIREFTSPEMFGELRLQLQERGASPNHTDVMSLDAELLGIEKTANEYVASVRFHGMIKEAENAPAEAFTEVWNLSKPASGEGGWVLAGIQQMA